jgi:hypothetical protein
MVDVWHWYSIDQARAAKIFAVKCGELEANPPGPNGDESARGLTWSEAAQHEHRALAIAAILSSVAFLEASINELYASAKHDNLEVGAKLSTTERQALRDVDEMLRRNSVLNRFQLTVRLLGKQPFDRAAQPYQNADLLIKLRNTLVHYEPQWRRGGGDDSQIAKEAKWARRLLDMHFSPHPFTSPDNPFFPDRCLGYGCAAWGWKTAVAFTDDFFARLSIKPIHDLYRSELTL